MQRTVVYFFTIRRKSIPFAFLSMAIDRFRIRNFRGISFAKMLGTGTGETFTPQDANLNRWGILAAIDENRIEAFDSSPVIENWRRRSTSEMRAILSPISSHGLWSKQNPFDFTAALSSPDAQIAAITRARIKWHQNFRFWRAVPPVVIDLHDNLGLISAIGIGEAPIGLQGTFSIWSSAAALRDFAYKGKAHQVAIEQTKQFNWYSEELFARFEVLNLRGSIATNTRN